MDLFFLLFLFFRCGTLQKALVVLEVGKAELPAPPSSRVYHDSDAFGRKAGQSLVKDSENMGIDLNSNFSLLQSVKWSPEWQLTYNLFFPPRPNTSSTTIHGIHPICSSTWPHHPACMFSAPTSQFAWQCVVVEPAQPAGWGESTSWNWQNIFPDIFRIFHEGEIPWDSTSDSSDCPGRLKWRRRQH